MGGLRRWGRGGRCSIELTYTLNFGGKLCVCNGYVYFRCKIMSLKGGRKSTHLNAASEVGVKNVNLLAWGGPPVVFGHEPKIFVGGYFRNWFYYCFITRTGWTYFLMAQLKCISQILVRGAAYWRTTLIYSSGKIDYFFRKRVIMPKTGRCGIIDWSNKVGFERSMYPIINLLTRQIIKFEFVF